MNTETGKLIDAEAFKDIPVLERKQFIPVQRDLTKVEQMEMEIKKYSPCACGSGKKFKFCCYAGAK